MTNTLDGFDFDMPPTVSQIVALAQYHRTLLDEAVFHQEIHLGDFCLAQRKRVYDFTRQLDENQRADFYETYNGELRRIADDDPAPCRCRKWCWGFRHYDCIGGNCLSALFCSYS